MSLAVAEYVTLRNHSCNLSFNVVAKTLEDKLHEALHIVTAPLAKENHMWGILSLTSYFHAYKEFKVGGVGGRV